MTATVKAAVTHGGTARKRRPPAWIRTSHTLMLTADALVAPVMATLLSRPGTDLGTTQHGVLVPVALAACWLLCLAIAGGYDARRAVDLREETRSVAMAAVSLAALIAMVTYLSDTRLPRALFLVCVLVVPIVSLVTRHIAHSWVARARRAGDLLERTLVVGRLDTAEALSATLANTPEAGYRPMAICAYPLDDAPLPDVAAVDGHLPVLPAATHLLSTVDTLEIDVVVVAAHSELSGVNLRRLTWALEERGIDLVVHPGLIEVTRPRLAVHQCSGGPLVTVRRPGPHRAVQWSKAAYDRALAALLVLMLLPVLAVTALAVRLSSPGPVIYRQQRIGRRGVPFTMLKFRTMVDNADAIRPVLESVDEGNGVLFKLRRDPRLTPAGHTLRRFSLDELPQLFNVLRGEMSLVGPRPPLPAEVEKYSPDDLRRLHTRPGLTGLWQIGGRSDLGWEDSVRLDLRYVDNWSPLMDLHILLRTLSAVIAGKGAY